MTPLVFESASKVYRLPGFWRAKEQPGLRGLSLEIKAGEVFGLLGLNGSGKTTTMKLALGLLRPTSGKVSLFGRDPWQRASLDRVGFLPELPAFYPYLTPAQALAFYGRLSALPARELDGRVRRALERVGLGAARDRKLLGFSKGMLQRVGMAQALLHEPDLLILDEPVSGLDPLAIKESREVLKAFNEEGRTIVLSSHSISEVEALCHRVAILTGGRLARVVASEEWKGRPGRLEEIFVETVR